MKFNLCFAETFVVKVPRIENHHCSTSKKILEEIGLEISVEIFLLIRGKESKQICLLWISMMPIEQHKSNTQKVSNSEHLHGAIFLCMADI